MEIITSRQNRFVKLARSLAERKFRAETGLFLAEGVNLLRDMPRDISVYAVFATESRYGEATDMFLNRSVEEGVICISDEVMKSISDTFTPYGIMAICRIPKTDFAFPNGNALLLDGVSDPGNVGTILRTSAACGFCDIYALETADIYSPKVIRATLGALFRLRVISVDEAQAVELVNKCNSAVLDMGGKNILGEKIKAPVLFIAGSEAHGVRDILKREAKTTYSLPMKNQIESLNVAVATAVAMYQTI